MDALGRSARPKNWPEPEKHNTHSGGDAINFRCSRLLLRQLLFHILQNVSPNRTTWRTTMGGGFRKWN